MRYFAFRDEVRLNNININPHGDHITFYMPMPKSWSRKKKAKMIGKPHQQKPDVDNLAKALLDSVFEDDSHIHDIRISKTWFDIGKIIIDETETVFK